MPWNQFKDITTLTNIQKTNMLMNPLGMGAPVSSQEYQVLEWLRVKSEQEIYRSLGPSGFLSKVISPYNLDTTNGTDTVGELVSLTTAGIPVSNTIRLGQSWALVNGWKVLVSNTDGANSIHNNIVLDTAPTSGTRNDLIFLEVWLAELGGSSASITNTSNKPSATTIYQFGNTQFKGTNVTDDIAVIDAEINRRWQIQYRLRVVDGVDIDTYADGVDDTSVVKAWGANPNGTWSGYTAGTGSVYTFANASNTSTNFDTLSDPGLYIAGDGSTTSKSVLGTVDGYVYAIPVAVVSRRNSGIYDNGTNPFGCATTTGTGSISSGISGRPDGYFYDQIVHSDILSLRHLTLVDGNSSFDTLLGENFDKLVRGKLKSKFGVGDGLGEQASSRNTKMLYSQEISTLGALDAGFAGIAQFNYQRRIFSDAPTVQQTQFTFTGGATPDNSLPAVLSAPLSATASTSTASGSLPVGTYYIVLTYVNNYGETTASAVSTAYTLASAGTITVNSPIPNANANGYNVYIGTSSSSGWTKQNGTVINIGVAFTQSTALSTTTQVPTTNTTSSPLTITADSSGLINGSATIVCVDGTTAIAVGSLPNTENIYVYNASTFAVIPGIWTGLGTVSASFKPNSPWDVNDTSAGVVAIVGISYPAGNGLRHIPDALVAQTVIQGANTYNLQNLGVSGISAADNSHFYSPSFVATDATGNIYVADTQNHRVVKFSSSLVYLNQFGVTGVSGTDNTHLNAPYSLTVDNSGNVFVSDSLNHRVVKLNSSLAYVSQFGVTAASGSDTAHLNTPKQIALDSTQANLYVADYGNNRIIKLTNALSFATVFVSTGVTSCIGVAVDANTNIYVTSQNYVYKFNSAAVLQSTFGSSTGICTNFGLNGPSQIALDSSSNILISDTNNHRIVILNPGFVFIGKFGTDQTYSTDFGHLYSPSGVSVSSTGVIYIADTANQRVLIIQKEMGCVDFPTRTLEVMSSGSPSDKVKIWYNYQPYQGVIAHQGSGSFSYKLKAITNLRNFVTTCGTGGKSTLVDQTLNGCITRLPFPAASFEGTPSNETEYVESGTSISIYGTDVSPAIADLPSSWGGSANLFTGSVRGNSASASISNYDIYLNQNTSTAYPLRGVNTLSRFVGQEYTYDNGYDYLGISVASMDQSIDHMTFGYFLAVATGVGATLPLIPGEIVLVVVGFRSNSPSAAIYSNTSNAVSTDIYRLNERPLVHL